MKKLIILSVPILLFASKTFSQSDSTVSDSTKKFRVSLGINYNSHLNYFGRTDSIKSSGFFPTLELNFGKHRYARASAIFSYSKGVNPMYNRSVVQAGYQFNSNNQWLGDL